MSRSQSQEIIELVDGTDVEFRFEQRDYFAIGTGRMETHKGREREEMIFLSREFTEVYINSQGRRVFRCPEWYATVKGVL